VTRQPSGRAEKHRLSLTFLKRTSLTAEKTAKPGDHPNGKPEGIGRSAVQKHNPEQAGHHAALRENMHSAGSGALPDRPGTRQSNESAGESVRSKVGSVKKRLSLFGMGGIGKKPSKASMMGGAEGVKEEE